MSWYNAIIEKLVEANPVEQAPLQEVKLFFQQLSEKIGQLYIEMGNAEGLIEQPQLFWKLLLILKENRGDFNSLKKNILDAIYQDLRNAPLEANQWQAFYQPFDIAFDNENLAEVELDDRIENLESLFELEQQEEINEQVARDFYAQRMAILLIKNGLPGKPSSFQNVSVSRCEALFNILLHMDSYDVDEVSKKNLFQLFEMFCQMDLIANSASWDALKEKLQVEQQAEKFNAFCELLFNYEGKNNFLKYLLNNDVLTNIEWLDENKGLFEEEDPIKAMNLALTNTDNIDFNQKVKQLVEIASEKNAKIYVGQLKCFSPIIWMTLSGFINK